MFFLLKSWTTTHGKSVFIQIKTIKQKSYNKNEEKPQNTGTIKPSLSNKKKKKIHKKLGKQ